jgi:hypothetical protein
MGSEVLLWTLFIICALAATVPWLLTSLYSSGYTFFRVPFASWFVLSLSGVVLVLDGVGLYFWRRFCRAKKSLLETRQELTGLKQQPLMDQIPTVCGHECLSRAEFLALLQILFRHPPNVNYIHVRPLPGGYGGSMTLLAKLQRNQDDSILPRSFVVKLGDGREMADEYDKFHNYVLATLPYAPKFFRHAEWGDFAGIAYEFAGLDPASEVQSFHQCYEGYTVLEVSDLVGQIYSDLDRAWYRGGQTDRANLYHEYGLLSRNKERIIGHVGEIIDEHDPYRTNFTAIEARLRPNLRPRFCPDLDIPWYDPVAFLRTWSRRTLSIPIYRSIVHGDLHARNALVEIGRDGQRRVWFIDFSHTGNGLSGHRTREATRAGTLCDPHTGHTLRDFCRLEADVKFILTRLQDDDDLRLAVVFERELMSCGATLYDLPVASPSIEALTVGRFRKAWQIIGEIRRRASAYLDRPDDLRPYYLSLLHATLPIVYYHQDQFEGEPCERQQKRYALISSGMLCAQL